MRRCAGARRPKSPSPRRSGRRPPRSRSRAGARPGIRVPEGQPSFSRRIPSRWNNRDLGSLSNIGVIYADREYPDSFDRAGGLDYRFRLHDRWTVTGQGLTSQTRNFSNSMQGEQDCATYALTCSGQAWLQSISYSDLHWNWWAAYSDTSAGFLTDTGFFERPDVRQPNGHLGYVFHPASGPILSQGPSIYTERIWYTPDCPLTSMLSLVRHQLPRQHVGLCHLGPRPGPSASHRL